MVTACMYACVGAAAQAAWQSLLLLKIAIVAGTSAKSSGWRGGAQCVVVHSVLCVLKCMYGAGVAVAVCHVKCLNEVGVHVDVWQSSLLRLCHLFEG